MIAHSARRSVALFAIALVFFGQIAMTVYACPVPGVAAPIAVTHGATPQEAAGFPCAGGHEVPARAQANLCEVHCSDGIGVPSQPDPPQVVLHALPAVTVPLADFGAAGSRTPAWIEPISGAPPLALQFCRLLI